MKAIIFLICILVCIQGKTNVKHAPTTPTLNKKTDFDFYVFASEWTGSVCSTNKCTNAYDAGAATNFWNIHGLWPSDGSMNVNYCTDEKFDPTQIAGQKDLLATYWSGLYSSADSFHGHEWEKHGTCSGMDQATYFSTVVKLAKVFDIYSTLQRNGIIPGGVYDCAEVADIIKEEYGVNIITLNSASGYLTELYLCVDKQFRPRDCASGKICKGNVKYPLTNL